ncbi:MAG: phosphotransferase family protein [Variovorax sp.]|nr:MAG: phosphotransferase family protein [Variovorax sp.]
MVLERIGGGQSNPTFFVSFDNRRLVLRKRPFGTLLPSAHAVDREFRVMNALAGSRVPVPAMLLYHNDPDIVGTAFYVMERVEGRVFPDCSMPGVTTADRREMMFSMADTLGALHRVDWRMAGLEGFGREGDFFGRQIARWTKQWRLSKTREIPDMEALIAWLPKHVPDGQSVAISHGDFRVGNLMFHPTEPRIVAVLDWELSTLGHPLADVAYSLLAWRLRPHEYMGMRGLDLDALGIPSEQEYLSRYSAAIGGNAPVTAFHIVFSLFRLAVIFEGIAARAKSGMAASSNAAEVGRLSSVFARRAIDAIEG